jgi:hypothetical protein
MPTEAGEESSEDEDGERSLWKKVLDGIDSVASIFDLV